MLAVDGGLAPDECLDLGVPVSHAVTHGPWRRRPHRAAIHLPTNSKLSASLSLTKLMPPRDKAAE
ncbi:hypothetical protein Cci01nite_40060 [Catellatospora citrea]|uniref:Uncharacterized protein n=1 Tax=Catellatospora citrea TaxID=53366 RepID=A0A8J3K9G8_9ACTN|nr:hypothetical protein Cci01nite_40060 [Catellatospora citrea]